jgi:hypothetical protein
MSRKLFTVIIVMFFAVNIIYAEEEVIIQNNEFYLKSLELEKLAQEAYDIGEYDASAALAEEAIRYAQRSDEYVTLQLQKKDAHDIFAAATERMKWADENNIDELYPDEFEESSEYYTVSYAALLDENWEEAIDAAIMVIEILAFIDGGEPVASDKTVLPKQYTVRTWEANSDCFWNIAGYSWVYGDPYQWKTLYDANKSKLPDPDNPNLIEPGIVLDIPSIKGEVREGMWKSSRP